MEAPEVKKRTPKDSVLAQEEERIEQGKAQRESIEVENSAEKSEANAIAVPQQNLQQHRPPPFPQRFQK